MCCGYIITDSILSLSCCRSKINRVDGSEIVVAVAVAVAVAAAAAAAAAATSCRSSFQRFQTTRVNCSKGGRYGRHHRISR